jgi:hypothetical protein
MRRDRFSYRLRHRWDDSGIGVAERRCYRTDLEQEGGRVVEAGPAGHRDGLRDRLAGDPDEAGAGQNAVYACRVGEREWPRGLRGRRWWKGEMPPGGGQGDGRPRIPVEGLPTDESQATTWTERGAQVRKGGGRVGKEHDAEAREDDVGVRAREDVRLRVGLLEVDGSCLGVTAPAAGLLEHHGRHVEAGDRAAASDPAGQLERGVAAAAADVDHPLARCDRGALHGAESEWGDLGIDQRADGHPAGPGALVPIAYLLGVRPTRVDDAHDGAPRRAASTTTVAPQPPRSGVASRQVRTKGCAARSRRTRSR